MELEAELSGFKSSRMIGGGWQGRQKKRKERKSCQLLNSSQVSPRVWHEHLTEILARSCASVSSVRPRLRGPGLRETLSWDAQQASATALCPSPQAG